MKLIIFPLLFLVVFAALSTMGVGTTWSGNGTFTGSSTEQIEGYYDSDGHLVCYMNHTAAGENGAFYYSALGDKRYWSNGTIPAPQLFNSASGADTVGTTMEFSMSTAMGLVVLVIALMALATIVGLRIFGSGISDVSVSALFKGTAYLGLWGVFSVLSFSMISMVPMQIGMIFYFFLTLVYTLGVVNQIGHPGED